MNLLKLGKDAIDYIKDDLTHWYALNKDVSVKISGENVTDLFGKQERMVCVGKLTIWSDTTDNAVVLTAHPFSAEEQLWNGANVIPNTDYESMLASLFHDLLYEYIEELAKKLNKSERAVRKWADDVLYVIWSQSATSKWERVKARIGHSICRSLGGVFHSISKWFILSAMLSTLSGCCVPNWTLESVEGEEQIKETIANER